MPKIIDFAINFDQDLWNDYQSYLITTNDSLKDNYVGLDPRTFACFPAVVINNQIICFSALQLSEEKWGAGIGRVSTRMWIHPDYRHTGRLTGGNKFLNTTYCLPLQLEVAKKLNLDCVFISREHNPLGFREYVKLIKTNCSVDFILEPSKYNVCGSLDPIPDSCKQWVAIHYYNQTGINRWDNQMRKYVISK